MLECDAPCTYLFYTFTISTKCRSLASHQDYNFGWWIGWRLSVRSETLPPNLRQPAPAENHLPEFDQVNVVFLWVGLLRTVEVPAESVLPRDHPTTANVVQSSQTLCPRVGESQKVPEQYFFELLLLVSSFVLVNSRLVPCDALNSAGPVALFTSFNRVRH